MTAITRDYFCDSCRRTHRIVSLVGQAHRTVNELLRASAGRTTTDRSAPRFMGSAALVRPADSRERIPDPRSG